MSNAETRLAELLETEWVPTNEVITLAVIRGALPAEAYGTVLVTLAIAKKPQADTIQAIAEATEMEGVFIALNGAGISFSQPDRQQQIERLATAGQWSDSLRDAVKSLGGANRAKWIGLGYQSEPTLATVQAEIDADNLAILRNDLRVQFDAIINQVGTSEQDDAIVSLRAIADELED